MTMDYRPAHPYNAGTEHVGFSPTRRALLAQGGGVPTFMHGCSRMTMDYTPSHPYNAGTEHVGLSPTRPAPRTPSAKRREVFGESHELWSVGEAGQGEEFAA